MSLYPIRLEAARPWIHPAALELGTLLSQCEIRRLRRSGPGGQHRNKVETAVALYHRPTGIRAEASERRSQPQNQREALSRLRVNLALAVRPPVEVGIQVSPLWRERSRGERIEVNPAHRDFPTLLACALDVLDQHEDDVRDAAANLGVSPSQLIKFLKVEPRALAQVNARRAVMGLKRLR